MKKSGELLKQCRLNKELTLDQLASLSGYSKSYLSLLEASKRPLTEEVMFKVLGCLKTSKIEISQIKESMLHESPVLSITMQKLKPHQKSLVIELVKKIPKLSKQQCQKIGEIL